MVATTEDEQQLRSVVDAVAADRVLVVCLSASADVVAERVAAREPDSWPGKADLIEHARLLADEVPSIDGIDVVLPTTDWRAVDVAAKVRDLLLEHGVLQRR